MNLLKRSVVSISWNIVANIIFSIVSIIEFVVLARLLPVDVFGIYAGVSAWVTLSSNFTSFGMGAAFIHRAPETKNEDEAASSFFTLKLAFTLVWATIMVLIGFNLPLSEPFRVTLLVLIATQSLIGLTHTPKAILRRRVMHSRLAQIEIIRAVISLCASVFLATQGFTLGALLIKNISGALITVFFLYFWRPVWVPRLSWSLARTRYFLRFGSQQLVAELLVQSLNKVDDIWTQLYLDTSSLGYYSRAFSLASYPSKLIATPFNTVITGIYAELKDDRFRLSKTFFWVNALLVRSGFFLAGLLMYIAPELIELLLGEKWLPMVNSFQLLVFFALFEPMKLVLSKLLIALGYPLKIVKIRLIQLLFLIFGLFTLGSWLGLVGVALSVNLMVIVGITTNLYISRKYVDYSLVRLFFVPIIALILAIVVTSLIIHGSYDASSIWVVGIVKALGFVFLYWVVIALLERDLLLKLINRAMRREYI